MTKQARRFLVTLIVAVVAGLIISVVFLSPRPASRPSESADETAALDEAGPDQAADDDLESAPDVPDVTAEIDGDADAVASDQEPGATGDEDEPPAETTASTLEGLHAAAPETGRAGTDFVPASLGSLDPGEARMLVEFSTVGAGMSRITLSDVWDTAEAKHRADDHYQAVRDGDPNPPPLPDASLRYVLATSQPFTWTDSSGSLQVTDVPVLAANSIRVAGRTIHLANAACWAEIAPGTFRTEILDAEGGRVLTITRTFTLGEHYDVNLDQQVVNHTGEDLEIQWRQYGPGDLFVDRSRYLDRRRFRFGYLFDAETDPSRSVVHLDDDMLIERSTLQRDYKDVQAGTAAGPALDEIVTLWPTDETRENGYELSVFASTNRYFAIAVHPQLAPDGSGPKIITSVVDEIEFACTDVESDAPSIFTYFYSPTHTLASGETLALDLGVYAGPQDREILKKDPRYTALNLGGLILYQMSSFCAICTFQWLAKGLLWFLSLVDLVILDWGIAIIFLVIVVRTLLHPITKKSQVNMRLFSEQMQAMKPELDKLQKKYADDPKKLQQEQMRFMREHNMNPATAALGCMPMFLQMPIWVALYAMLYFAYDLRHQPAFYGIFQELGGWPFLADLSASDHFFGEFEAPTKFLLWNITGINLLPILMGVFFFLQQKYMSPPPSPNMTPEQMTQQRIMKIMMVVMFPLMLYSAPSGLTLYILTSTTIGIIESKYIRAHISQMDVQQAVASAKGPGRAARRGAAKGEGKRKKKPKDAQGRAYADAIERAKEKAKRKSRGPDKQYKKRK